MKITKQQLQQIIKEELEQILIDIRQTSNDDRSSQQASQAENLLSVIARN